MGSLTDSRNKTRHKYRIMAAAFNGSWACQSTEGLDGVLKELGVGMIKRKVAVNMKPTLSITFAADGSSFNFSNGQVTKTMPVGKPFDDEVGGAPVTSHWTVSGNKMSNKAEFKKNPGKFVVLSREVNGTELTQSLEFNGKKVVPKVQETVGVAS